ncbi:MAG TPA: hypothetical protein VFD39_06865, partial [Trueperaceae bacterium]|nr:hypothetical protein [Trueperaceae bacterium]
MRRAPAALEGVAGGLLVIFPPAAAALLLLLGLGRGNRSRLSAWTWIWAGYLVPLLAVTLLTGRDPIMPALQAVFGVLIGALVVVERRKAMLLGIVLGLLVTVASGLVERELSRRLWWDASTPLDLVHLLNGVSEISGASEGWTRNGVRLVDKTWTLSRDGRSIADSDQADADQADSDQADADQADADQALPAGSRPNLELSFEVRGTSEQFGWQWYTNHPATAQVLLS